MINQLREKIAGADWSVLTLQVSLMILFLFITLLIPTFEPGPDLAVLSASLAIVILSLLNSRSSEKQTELLERQQEILENQNQNIELLIEQHQMQSELLEDLSEDLNSSDSTHEPDEVNSNGETDEVSKSTDKS